MPWHRYLWCRQGDLEPYQRLGRKQLLLLLVAARLKPFMIVYLGKVGDAATGGANMVAAEAVIPWPFNSA